MRQIAGPGANPPEPATRHGREYSKLIQRGHLEKVDVLDLETGEEDMAGLNSFNELCSSLGTLPYVPQFVSETEES